MKTVRLSVIFALSFGFALNAHADPVEYVDLDDEMASVSTISHHDESHARAEISFTTKSQGVQRLLVAAPVYRGDFRLSDRLMLDSAWGFAYARVNGGIVLDRSGHE